MVKKRKGGTREYRFKIDAYSPETMPLSRLAEYLADLSVLFGEDKSVHLIRIEGGSTDPILLVEREAEPKVRARLRAVKQNNGPPEAMRANDELNEKLREDNATGEVIDPAGGKVLVFPGCERAEPLAYGPFNQPGVLIGIPIKLGGEQETVPIHLQGRYEKYICFAKRSKAKEIAEHIFTNVIRVEGTARWIRRPSGLWEMLNFTVKDFKPLADASLREAIQKLRAIPAKWKNKEDPLGELMDIRHGTDG